MKRRLLLTILCSVSCAQPSHTIKEWLELAEGGDPSAQNVVGGLYQDGDTVKQDYAAAQRWYKRAAEQGDPDGQANLGYLYFAGLGVPQDYYQAFTWLRAAADQGNSKGMLLLGGLYRLGQGVPKNYIESCKWFILAVSKVGSSEAQDYMKMRDSVCTLLSSAEVSQAQRLASEWKPKAQGKR
jgi:TPR repeat protein